jgi:hypothetical protein
MAAPSSCIPIAILLVVFATANLPQSAAIVRDEAASPPIAVQGMLSDFPCFPFLPPFLRDMCRLLLDKPYPSCRPALKELVVPSCAAYLTNPNAPDDDETPSQDCCDDLSDFFNGTISQYCLCHVANGDVAQLLPAPLNRKRAISVISDCDIGGWDAGVVKYACITHRSKFPLFQ